MSNCRFVCYVIVLMFVVSFTLVVGVTCCLFYCWFVVWLVTICGVCLLFGSVYGCCKRLWLLMFIVFWFGLWYEYRCLWLIWCVVYTVVDFVCLRISDCFDWFGCVLALLLVALLWYLICCFVLFINCLLRLFNSVVVLRLFGCYEIAWFWFVFCYFVCDWRFGLWFTVLDFLSLMALLFVLDC